ncbi:uncharacterized protein LOC129409747 isoform X2 [Boleophthalmus pectinirostris]|uniref:uncharacterized protein LOC129409747 isoform X2 n=1 Tax=Boleophthalmus pectinirostris TaxID=150288 RepID=UPI002432BD02|nr:uncharacterized protein LOC129409747 isoform X2 [Boleophthalmus pectinirostris]
MCSVSVRMRPAPRLLLLLVLCGGRGFTSAETFFFTQRKEKTLGKSFCFIHLQHQMYFCKNDCEKRENILVQTSGTREQNGRYSIGFERYSNPYVLHVGINNLMSSDSGSYRCEFWNGTVMEETVQFHLEVSRAEPHVSKRPSVTFSVEHHVTPVASTLTPPELLPSGPSRLLWLLLIPVAVVMTSVPLLLICRKKKTQNDQEPRRSRTETEAYENTSAVRESADCTYQSLCVDTMDPNQIYSTV